MKRIVSNLFLETDMKEIVTPRLERTAELLVEIAKTLGIKMINPVTGIHEDPSLDGHFDEAAFNKIRDYIVET